MQMNYSPSGYALTKEFEGCRLTAYRDGGGVLTNGYGNTHHVMPGQITQAQADADLEANIQDSVDSVNDLVKVHLTQGQFNSLVDFSFNLGSGALENSTLLRLLNAGDYAGAALQFLRWDHDNGKVVAGLTRRCEARQLMFNEGGNYV